MKQTKQKMNGGGNMNGLDFVDEWANGAGKFFVSRSAQGYLQPAMAVAGPCGSSCGAGGDEKKPSACGSSCGAGDDGKKEKPKPSSCGAGDAGNGEEKSK
jgi:hypothetical protein